MPKQISVATNRLRPNPWNPNHVSPDLELKLQESVRKLGMFKPIVVREKPDGDTDFEILGGENRWRAAVEIGLEDVPIFNVGNIDDVTAKKIAVTDNSRYGADDSIELAKLLEEIGSIEEIQSFLPFSETDITSIFSNVNIAVDELDLPEGFDENEAPANDAAPEKATKTHTIMRFKVTIADAEKVTELLSKVQKRQSFTGSDDLTNAGDALVHQLLNIAEA